MSHEFYLSLEDDLMKRFGSERLKGVFERLNMSDEAIESRMLTRQVEAAQKTCRRKQLRHS